MMDSLETIPYVNSVFEQPWWLETVAPGRWREAVVRENGEVIARLPYVVYKGRMGERVGMPKLTQTLGAWIDPRIRQRVNGNKQLYREKEIINQLMAQLPEKRPVSICLDSANRYVLPYRWLGFRIEPTFSYRISDLRDLDGVYARFDKSTRQTIRSAGRKLFISRESDVQLLWKLLDITFKHQKRSIPLDQTMVKRIVEESCKRDQGLMLSAMDERGNCHSMSFFIYDERICYNLLSGSDPAYRSSGAQSLVIWEGIQFAAKNSNVFDFEGSMVEGIENFFRRFGGEMVTNYRITRQSLGRDCMDMLKPRVKRMLGYKI